MATYDYDLFIIGGGSGGVRAARIASSHGARVAIAEEYRYGGTCVIRGCVPKKLFVYGSSYAGDFADAAAYGWKLSEPGFDWPTLVANKDAEIDRLSAIYVSILERAGAAVHEGRAHLLDAHTVEVGRKRITAERILVATGSKPWKPMIPGIELALTSNEMFHLHELPPSLLVIGGGYIAVEFADIMRGFGVDVTLMYRRGKILRGFDDDVRDAVERNLLHNGVELVLNMTIDRIEKAGSGLRVTCADGAVLEVGALLCATGRTPNTQDMGLQELGVELGHHGAVVVDEYSKSSVDNIYAVGDVTDRINLTPVAIHEAHAFADSVYGNTPRPVDHQHVPSAVFAQPTAASVGLTEQQARETHARIDVYRSAFKPLKHTLTHREQKSMMKLIVDADTQRVLGAHMVGEHAAEIVQCLAIAVKMGATKADFDRTLGIHPTAAEEFVTMRKKVS